MLHYIYFPYVCDVALEVFRTIWNRGAVRNGVRWGTGTVARWGMEDRGTIDAVPFHSIPIRFCGTDRFGKGSGVRTQRSAPHGRALVVRYF
jgi:hypothetical protein